MTFSPADTGAFLHLFEGSAERIRQQPGCRHLELWQDERYSNIFTTYSTWSSREDLERYRSSAFFKETWQQTRKWFAAPAQAFSYHRSRTIPKPPMLA